jgi:hypothetical protein
VFGGFRCSGTCVSHGVLFPGQVLCRDADPVTCEETGQRTTKALTQQVGTCERVCPLDSGGVIEYGPNVHRALRVGPVGAPRRNGKDDAEELADIDRERVVRSRGIVGSWVGQGRRVTARQELVPQHKFDFRCVEADLNKPSAAGVEDSEAAVRRVHVQVQVRRLDVRKDLEWNPLESTVFQDVGEDPYARSEIVAGCYRMAPDGAVACSLDPL